MRKSVFVIAVAAAACSGVAVAGEVQQGKKASAPAAKAQIMNDAQMDKVTAGDAGNGNAYAFGKQDGKGWEAVGFVGNGHAYGHNK
jgi:hypothetical protein